MNIIEPLQIAIEELSKLPTIGRKTAQRLALYILKSDKDSVANLIKAVTDLKEKIKFCSVCFNLSVDDTCEVCKSPKRDKSIICVVEEASDVIAIESTNEYKGLYHVLGGVLSPLSGKGVESLKIAELVLRVNEPDVKEIVLALNPDTEGETTSLYLTRRLKPLNKRITRLPTGLPLGGDLEFTDHATVGRAILNRIEL
ncbi:MAG: recombination mediator RecR [Bacteroidetes bacterium]|nr:recombination mediator RecR [Bacteroidota bacterium]